MTKGFFSDIIPQTAQKAACFFKEEMNYRKLNLTLAAILLSGLFLLAKETFAAVRCETQYGGGEVCVKTGELQIDKEVWDSQNSKFVDNLGLTSYRFSAGEEITFKLRIKNIGDENFSKVEVKDTLPDFLYLTSGDLDFEINDLAPGETEEREIKAKVVNADKLPSDKSTVCVVNTAETWSDDEHDKDTSQICLEKKVLGVTPVTGPESGLLILSFSLFAAITGFSFLKLSQKYSRR